MDDWAELRRRLALGLARDAHRAAQDPDAFFEFVIRDEDPARGRCLVRQGQHHRRWQRAWTEHDRLVLFAPVEHGKTTGVVGRLLWEIQRSPAIRCAYISATAHQAQKVLGAVRAYIDESPDYRAVHGGRVRQTQRDDEKWTQQAITVDRPFGIRDPTLQALGAGGPILGSRLDLIVVDDVLDFENTMTPDARRKVVGWFKSTVVNRLARNGHLWIIGTPWHPQDLLHVLEAEGWPTIRDPAVQDGKALWPEQWDLARLAARKRVLNNNLEFARQFMVQARDDQTARFRQEWFDHALRRGREIEYWAPMLMYDGGWPAITGVDLAVQQGEENDLTSVLTYLLCPNGDRQLLAIETGRWTAQEISTKVLGHLRRYRSHVGVESNAAQDYMRQWIGQAAPGAVVRGIQTTAKGKAFGVESIATELETGKWILPCTRDGQVNPDVQGLIDECLYYSPGTHTGDRLMSWVLAREMERRLGTGVDEDVQLPGGNMIAR